MTAATAHNLLSALIGVLAAVLLVLSGGQALARAVDCEAIAAQTAARHGVPAGLMPAIARVETGLKQGKKGVRAWPWTLNVQGKGYYFKTRAEALAKLRQVLAQGVRNVDVGCMQINYRWHAENFASIEEMMTPEANTKYAAKFLTRLKKRHGSWEAATRHYHSADEVRGKAYLGRVNRVLAKLPQDQPSFVASTADTMPQTATATEVATGTTMARQQAEALRRSRALSAIPGQDGRIGNVVLPDSPLPQLATARAGHKTARRQWRLHRLSTSRQQLVAQLRAEFAR